MDNRLAELSELVRSCEEDYRKFTENQNREAGVRLRRALQKIRETAAILRREIQTTKAGFAPKIPRPKKGGKTRPA